MKKLIYSIAGLSVCMEMPFQTNISEESTPFLIGDDANCLAHVRFIPVDVLPPVPTDGIWHQDRCYSGNSYHIRSAPGEEPYAAVEYDENGCIRICYLRQSGDMIRESRYLINMVGLERLLLHHEGLILHASFISWQGRGILFSAPSGTGKSTQAKLWEKHMGAAIINGDRAGIRCVDGKWSAYGLPYAGSSRIFRNESMPIQAIVILRRHHENRIRRMEEFEALRDLLPEFSAYRWSVNFMNKVLDIATELLQDVPVYCLECRPEQDAVQLLHDVLTSEENL